MVDEHYHPHSKYDQSAVTEVPRQPGDIIEEKYNAARDGILGRIKGWVSGPGFVKGVLITAAIVGSVIALFGGWLAGGGGGGLAVGGSLVKTFEAGITQGAGKALQFLVNPIGWGTLLAGGLAGSYIDSKNKSRQMTGAEAQAKAKELEAARARTPEPQREMAPEPRRVEDKPSRSFVEAETARRTQPPSAGIGV